ncbi:sulfatase-like hydrolase/transferase [Flexithrix dorotheae]|uniref:sulfatase-like hydrolase/transferase n=1 Tax=Flexithrix dorotheae TaxID=70993 RepID=UPI000366043C|nr:sulfatase-like hydrolase/transferase [Flexithrix dorotheae]
MHLNFYAFLLLASLLISCARETAEQVKVKPNILLIVADDMGYGDLGCYEGFSNTPNLNKLAKNGIQFTDFYAAAPNCSPSRTGLLTGKSPAIVGMYNYRPPGHPIHLRDEEVTIAEVLKNQGYRTAHIGKWHLGCLPQDTLLNHPQPIDQGFDYSLGTENNAQPSHLNPVNFVRNGERLPEQQGYSCQILADEAVSWFENYRKDEDPFFMYLAFHEPHAKVASPPELVEKYGDFPQKDAEYLANIENLDLAVGRVISYLTDHQLLENTIVIFSSDNGSYRQASNGDLRAVKSYVYDGGIRVPGIFHWSGFSAKGLISEAAGFVDIMPTLCDILQISPFEDGELDGTSILGLLNGKAFERENPLFWYFYRTSPEIAVRMDQVMVLGKDQDTIPKAHRFSKPDMAYIKEMELLDYELYDLANDQGQDQNIISSHPNSAFYKQVVNEKLKEIQSKGYHWDKLPEPEGTLKVKTDWVKYKRVSQDN